MVFKVCQDLSRFLVDLLEREDYHQVDQGRKQDIRHKNTVFIKHIASPHELLEKVKSN